MKSYKTPTPETVNQAVASMVRLEQQRYFFDRLENPNWLEPLKKKGFFSTPPTPKRDEERGTIEFQVWPAARYLSRMAPLAPDVVSSIILSVPETENPFIVRDFLKAALSMPGEVAATISDKLGALIRTPFLIGSEMAGDLAVNLARVGKREQAFTVLKAALEIVPDPRPVAEELKSFDRDYRHEARSRIRPYEYEQILQRKTHDLATLLGAEFVRMLAKLLVRALELEHVRDKGFTGKKEDYSYIWLPNLSSVDHRESPKRILISSVLVASDYVSSQGAEQFVQIRAILGAQKFKVFERLDLEIISRHLDIGKEAAVAKLTDKHLFNDLGVRPEYYSLSAKAFGLLDLAQKATILQWIDEGLDRQRLLANGLSAETAEAQIEHWQLERLAPIAEHLPPEWKQRYQTLEEKFGKPPHPQYPAYSGGAYAITAKSPRPVEDLDALSVEEVIAYLKSWRPSPEEQQGPFGASEDGLASVLTSIVGKKAARFAERLQEMKPLDPTYVRGTLQGFESALRAHEHFDWEAVLDFCLWIVSQPVQIPGRTGGSIGTRDPDWSWTRQALVSLIDAGFRQKEIPFDVREVLWRVLSDLAAEEDPDDRLDYRNQDSKDRDIWSASINRIRPRAIRNMIMYLEWCRDNLRAEKFSFHDVPEVEALLQKHLDVAIDSSLDVRLIYGEFLPFLMSVDSLWVKKNIEAIFPRDPALKYLKDVAWVAYLTANSAYDQAFEILRSEYVTAIEELGSKRELGRGHMLDQPDEKLAQHLLQLYWRGRIGLDSGGILERFYNKADDALLGHAVTYAGRSISSTKDIPDEILGRLQQLWDYHLSRAAGSGHMREMAAFGWWFNSGYFEDGWALEHLLKSLQLSNGNMEPKLGTLQRLAKLAERYPDAVIKCTELIVDAELVDVILWVDDLTTILQTLLKSGTDASKVARKIVQKLGVRGHLQYRSLLSGESS